MSYHIPIFDPAIFRLWITGQNYLEKRTEYVRDWCKQEDADLCFNLGIFGMATGLGCSDVTSKGRPIAYGNHTPKLLVIDGNNSCRGYSDGIVDGAVKINFPMHGKALRNGLGVTDKGVFFVAQTNHAVTEVVFCNYVNEYMKVRGHRVKLFTLQDGGGSTSEYSAVSGLNFAPGGNRKVANALCVKLRKPPTISHTLYVGCPYADEVKLAQTMLGGIEVDGSFGAGTKARVLAAQKAWGFPVGLQCGVLGTMTLRALGFNPDL